MKNKKKLIPIAAIVIMGIVFTVIVKKIRGTFICEDNPQIHAGKCSTRGGDIAFALCVKKSDNCVSAFHSVLGKWSPFPSGSCCFDQYNRARNYDYNSIWDW